MIDLHTHTTISDGVYTPEELVQRSIPFGITVLCMTDHIAVNENLVELRENIRKLNFRPVVNFSAITEPLRI